MKNKITLLYKKNKNFINYAFVSIMSTIIMLSLYALIDYLTNGLYLLANVISYTVSFLFLYFFDCKVFNYRPRKRKERIKQINNFILFRSIGLLLDSFFLSFLIEEFYLSNFLGKVFSSLMVFIYNYYTNKEFVFKDKYL